MIASRDIWLRISKAISLWFEWASCVKLARTEGGTVVGMHMSADNVKEAEKHHINVVIAGHMASDTIGINLFLDEIYRKEPMDVISTSGFERIRRI